MHLLQANYTGDTARIVKLFREVRAPLSVAAIIARLGLPSERVGPHLTKLLARGTLCIVGDARPRLYRLV